MTIREEHEIALLLFIGLTCKVLHDISVSSKNIFIKAMVSINLFYNNSSSKDN